MFQYSRLNNWIKPPDSNINYILDNISLQILSYLYNDEDHTRGHTKSQMATMLNVWDDIIQQHLDHLNQLGYIHHELISFGLDLFGNQKTIQVYHMTELGRFFIRELENHYPGLCPTKIQSDL